MKSELSHDIQKLNYKQGIRLWRYVFHNFSIILLDNSFESPLGLSHVHLLHWGLGWEPICHVQVRSHQLPFLIRTVASIKVLHVTGENVFSSAGSSLRCCEIPFTKALYRFTILLLCFLVAVAFSLHIWPLYLRNTQKCQPIVNMLALQLTSGLLKGMWRMGPELKWLH